MNKLPEKPSRDNFKAATISRLRERVANRCSNPDCRVVTIGPGGKSLEATCNIGKAAHISAASKGGPRYDESLTEPARKAIENGIWLCSNCATLIDADSTRYSIHALQDWKSQAESTATLELGKKPPSQGDVRNEISAALGGFPLHLKRSSIANVHAAVEANLNKVDSRFLVQTSHTAGKTFLHLEALEDVDFSFNVPCAHATDWSKAIDRLIDHGGDVSFCNMGVGITGSPLFDVLGLSQQGSYSISLTRNKNQVPFRLKLLNSADGHEMYSIEIHGFITWGVRTYTFSGSALGGLLSINVSGSISAGTQSKNAFLMNTNFQQWFGRDVRNLPHRTRIAQFFKLAAQGHLIEVAHEIDGVEASKFKVNVGADIGLVIDINRWMQYIDHAVDVLKYLDIEVPFQLNQSPTDIEFNRLADIASIIRGEQKIKATEYSVVITSLIIADKDCSNVKQYLELVKTACCLIQKKPGENLTMFGVKTVLPMLEIRVNAVQPRIRLALSAISPGDEVKVEWMPCDGFLCTYRYLKDSDVISA